MIPSIALACSYLRYGMEDFCKLCRVSSMIILIIHMASLLTSIVVSEMVHFAGGVN